MPHTHIFLLCTWFKDTWIVLVRAFFFEVIPSHPCFVALCLMHFSPFPTLAPSSMTAPSLLFPSASSTPAAPQGGWLFGRLAERSPLTGYEPKTTIEVSTEHTPINLLSRKGSFDSDLDDLATIVDASEIIDTTGGTVDFTTFSGARSKCLPIQCVSGSQAPSSVARHMRRHWETSARHRIVFKHGETTASC